MDKTELSMRLCLLKFIYLALFQIMDTLVNLHRGIQELEIFHFGGDEVVAGAWDNSPSCQKLFKQDVPVKLVIFKLNDNISFMVRFL